MFNMLDQQGMITYTAMANNTRIRSLFMYENFVYSMGDQHLTKRDLLGNIIEEKMLPYSETGYISATEGKILNGRAYATDIHNYIFKFSLAGEQLFKKDIGTLTDNHFLDVGGNFIYVYSSITNPALGSRLMQYDTLGNQKWSVPIGSLVYGMYADEEGNCYMLTSETGGSGHVQKYNLEGELVYDVKLPGQRGMNAFKSRDSLFVCGQVSGAVRVDGQKMAAFCILSAKTGEVYHQQTIDLDPDPSHLEDFTHIASDGSNIYVGGYFGGQGKTNVLIKYSRVGNTTGLKEDADSRSGYKIFPNPGGSKFTITCENNKSNTVNVTVRNISGQVVYQQKISCNPDKSFTLDLGKQPSGNYMVEIGAGADKTIKKIIVE